MLTAAAAQPTTKLKRKIIFHEDEVTSCIFGEMQHLPTDVIWMIFNQLTKDAIKDDKTIGDLFHESPDKVNFEFWPQWETKSGHVEPDLVVHFYKQSKPILNIIVEVKWGASLYPPCELIRQWSHRHTDISNTAPWVHLYLVKDISVGMTEIVSSLSEGDQLCKNKNCVRCVDKNMERYMGTVDTKEWRRTLGCIGWRHLIVAVTQIVKGNPLWDKGVSIFFAKQGIEPFVGFEWIKIYFEIGEVSEEEMIFFRKVPWFSFLNSESFGDNVTEEFFPVENVT